MSAETGLAALVDTTISVITNDGRNIVVRAQPRVRCMLLATLAHSG